MTTGIFYHPSFSRRSYLTQGSRLQHFPAVLQPLLNSPRGSWRLYESPPVDEQLLLQVHTPRLLQDVRDDPLCSTAWLSAGGVVSAAEKIVRGEIRNGFAFIGAGGHHAGRNFFGGFCCFNDVVLAIRHLRENHGVSRFAILDTDAHHGDGTRSLLKDDPRSLHVCICSFSRQSSDGTKVDVPLHAPRAPLRNTEALDPRYVEAVLSAFQPRAQNFEPELLFWYFGFDTHQGDYGDAGLTSQAYTSLAGALKKSADDICEGRLLVVLGGGSRGDIAAEVIPPVIKALGR